MLGDFFMEEFVMGEENFHEGNTGFSSISFSTETNKIFLLLFSCKYSIIISVKRNINYYAYEGLTSS